VASYLAFWQGATKEERASIGKLNHDEFKGMAESVDAERTVDATASEVAQ